jgi:hypothetical protein
MRIIVIGEEAVSASAQQIQPEDMSSVEKHTLYVTLHWI